MVSNTKKIKMNNNIISLLATFLFVCVVSCHNENKLLKDSQVRKRGEFYVRGEMKYNQYTFCAITPQVVEYHYKSGEWKYWNDKKELIAEGAYKIIEEHIETNCEGGTNIKRGEMEIDKWNFYNAKGNKIKPSKEFLKKLKTIE